MDEVSNVMSLSFIVWNQELFQTGNQFGTAQWEQQWKMGMETARKQRGVKQSSTSNQQLRQYVKMIGKKCQLSRV